MFSVPGRASATPSVAAADQFVAELLTQGGPAVYPVVAVAGGDAIAASTSGMSAESSILIGRISASAGGR